MSGRVKKWLYLALFLTIFFVLVAGFFFVLVEQLVLPPVLARAGLADYKISISRLGLNGCSFYIAGRPHLASPVVAGNIRVDWTPFGLLQRRIDKVSSDSLQINLAGLPAGRDTAPEKEEYPGQNSSYPFVIEQVVVNNGALFFQAGQQVAYLPFTFSAQRIGDFASADSSGAIFFQTKIQAAQNVVDGIITLDPSHGILSGKLTANLDLASLVSIIPFFQSVTAQHIKGNGQFTIDAALQTAPFALREVQAAFVSDNLMVTGNGVNVLTQQEQPARVEVSGSGTRFKLKSTGLHLAGPVWTALDIDADISFPANNLQWAGTLDLTPEPGFFLHDSLMLKDVQPIRISYSGSKVGEKTNLHLMTAQPEDGAGGSAFILQQNDITATFERFAVDAGITYEQRSGTNTLAGTLLLHGYNVTVESLQGIVTVPDIELQADGTAPPGQIVPAFTARLKVDDASLEMEKQGVSAQGLRFELPIVWPPAGNMDKGILEVAAFRLGEKKLGSLKAEVVQTEETITFDGILQTVLLPADRINLTGTLQLPEQNGNYADLAVSLHNGGVAINNLVPLIPALQGASGRGNVDVQGNLSISPCGLSGQADVVFTGGNFVLPDAETEFENIRFSFRFPSFPSVNTLPMQQLSIGTIRKKKLVVNDVKVVFEIESPSSLFIEKIAGRWSEGRVFTSSFRLQKGQDAFDLAIFCDRLELSSILSQFNLAEAGGEGRMSGRVPIAYVKGKFFIDDGFLFSSPGEKGYLKIKQSKYLETTVPADVPYFSPLHFAGAAMADFEYNWAKLQIKSEGENMLLKLQVDGKPREKLPFRFDAEQNVFVRLADESKGGIDQPIQLDVNFNVPVNEMFYYKDKLMPLFQKIN